MSSISEVPKSMRTCENCRWQNTNSRFVRCFECKGLGSRNWEEHLTSLRTRAEAIIADLKKRVVASDNEVLQTLGKALGYAPLFPEASRVDDGQVNVGEHVPTTIALAAAKKIAELTRERDDLTAKVHDLETASWAHAVQDTAAWKGRAEVAERALDGARARVDELEKLYLTRELDEEEREELRGQLAAMRETLMRVGADDACGCAPPCQCNQRGALEIWKHEVQDIAREAIAPDAGKPEADVIAAAVEETKAEGKIKRLRDLPIENSGIKDAPWRAATQRLRDSRTARRDAVERLNGNA